MTVSRRLSLAAAGAAVAAAALVAATQVGAGAGTKPIGIPDLVSERVVAPPAEAPAVPDADAYAPVPDAGTVDLSAPAQ
ncbi:hypothetical protein ABFT23_06865 [Nocardioides sp. C4-1]|uniref:hypothetical protein n=1 Tax=Nocardioides sp. C4-1 TaxID=3151851 RepID=UPI0032670D62